MTTTAPPAPRYSAAPELSDAPKLRLLSSDPGRLDDGPCGPTDRTPAERATAHAPDRRRACDASCVLVAGRDPARRAMVLDDLARTMPPSTRFQQADAFWEVLVQAPASSMIVLSGELDERPTDSLLGMLSHRHPGLPVISIDGPASLGRARARA